MDSKQKKVITFGTFDLLHEGHINLFKKCRELGGELYVGVTTAEFNDKRCDQLGIPRKQHPYQSLYDRMKAVQDCGLVDHVFVESQLNTKSLAIMDFGIDVAVFGDDMDDGRFDYLKQYCEVVFVPRTPNISSTMLRDILNSSED